METGVTNNRPNLPATTTRHSLWSYEQLGLLAAADDDQQWTRALRLTKRPTCQGVSAASPSRCSRWPFLEIFDLFACTWSKILNRLVNYLHLFFIHTATVHFDFRESSVDLKQIRSR
jgi:hypothetical protein